MKDKFKLLLFAYLSLFSLLCYSAESTCTQKLREFGIEIIETEPDSVNPDDRVIEFIFDENFQTEDRQVSVATIRYRQQPNFHLSTALFVGKHQRTHPDNKSIYVVFIDKRMLPFLELSLLYMIDSKYQENYLNVDVSGFDNLDTLKCRHISHK